MSKRNRYKNSRSPPITLVYAAAAAAAAAALQVGVLGWTTASTAATAPSVGNLQFLPEAAAVQKCLAELKAQHRDLHYIIGLSHGGALTESMVYCCCLVFVTSLLPFCAKVPG
jgi:2',3'-cyclic-nucleotide 2'-phosphodiesterase (5'-nucleotidase family)